MNETCICNDCKNELLEKIEKLTCEQIEQIEAFVENFLEKTP